MRALFRTLFGRRQAEASPPPIQPDDDDDAAGANNSSITMGSWSATLSSNTRCTAEQDDDDDDGFVVPNVTVPELDSPACLMLTARDGEEIWLVPHDPNEPYDVARLQLSVECLSEEASWDVKTCRHAVGRHRDGRPHEFIHFPTHNLTVEFHSTADYTTVVNFLLRRAFPMNAATPLTARRYSSVAPPPSPILRRRLRVEVDDEAEEATTDALFPSTPDTSTAALVSVPASPCPVAPSATSSSSTRYYYSSPDDGDAAVNIKHCGVNKRRCLRSARVSFTEDVDDASPVVAAAPGPHPPRRLTVAEALKMRGCCRVNWSSSAMSQPIPPHPTGASNNNINVYANDGAAFDLFMPKVSPPMLDTMTDNSDD